MKSREVHLTARPEGIPTDSDFSFVETDVADPGPGEVLVRNLYMSVDPAMRPRLRDVELDTVLMGGSVGKVEVSNHDDLKVGDIVQSGYGFREYYVSDGKGIAVMKTDPDIPLTAYMGPLGGTGYTAYGGILDIGKLQEGETLFVSTAAGAVGSVAAQMGKIMNCFVIGSTGSDEKVKWLVEEAGIDRWRRSACRPARGGPGLDDRRRRFGRWRTESGLPTSKSYKATRTFQSDFIDPEPSIYPCRRLRPVSSV